MSAPAMPARRLAVLLADTAGHAGADAAAVGLVIAHGYFLDVPAFRNIVAAGSAALTGGQCAVIRWRAVAHALDTGTLTATPSAEAVLRIAASLGDDHVRVSLASLLPALTPADTTLITGAITAAAAQPPGEDW